MEIFGRPFPLIRFERVLVAVVVLALICFLKVALEAIGLLLEIPVVAAIVVVTQLLALHGGVVA